MVIHSQKDKLLANNNLLSHKILIVYSPQKFKMVQELFDKYDLDRYLSKSQIMRGDNKLEYFLEHAQESNQQLLLLN